MSRVTKKAVLAAKEKYGTIYIVTVSDQELNIVENQESSKEIGSIDDFSPKKNEFYALLHKPGKREVGVALTYRDPVQMGNSLLKNCIIKDDEGNDLADEAILQDEDVNISASLQVVELVNLKAASLKKY